MTIAKSNVESVVATLEDYMATKSPVGAKAGGAMVPHFLGDAGAAAATNAERIVWVPEEDEIGPPVTGQVPEGDVCAEADDSCLVTIYASDFARLLQIRQAFVAALEDVLSPKGYFIGKGKFGKPGATNAGYSLERRIVLRGPIFREIWLKGQVDTVTKGVAVTGDLAAEPVVSDSL